MKNILVYKKSHTLKDILMEIDLNGNGFILLVKKDFYLIGIITDGDIRRAILNQKTDLSEIINHSPRVFKSEKGKEEAKKYIKSVGVRQLPIVDKNNKLIDIIYLNEDEYNFKPNKVVIMAGGLGTRLGELTKDIPKPMLEVGGKPLLEVIINSFIESRFNKFILCVNYKSKIIEDYFMDGSKWGIEIEYVKEKKRMGTAGALSLIQSNFKEPFFVVNGDILTTIKYENFLDFHITKKSKATIAVKNFQYQLPYASINIDEDNKMIGISEKPVYSSLINAGVYILSPEIVSLLPNDEFYDMPTLLEKISLESKDVFTFSTDEYWLDIGHKSDYEKANNDIKIDKL